MAKKTWQFELEDCPHVVELDLPATSKPKITVDGQFLEFSLDAMGNDIDGDYSFFIGEHKGIVHIYSNGLSCLYELTIDGCSPTTGLPLDSAKIARHYKKGHIFQNSGLMGFGLMCVIFGENWVMGGIPLPYVGMFFISLGIYQILLICLGKKDVTKGPIEKIGRLVKSIILLEGKNETFTTTEISKPPVESSGILNQYNDQLAKLGFQFLGDLAFRKSDGIIAYTYSHKEQSTYALLYVSSLVKVPCDLFSVFVDGVSLTTSTTPMSYGDIPESNIYRNSYPNADIPGLFELHRKRLHSLELEQRELSSVGVLKDLAISMDDYLSREPSGFWFMMRMHLIQFWYFICGKLN